MKNKKLRKTNYKVDYIFHPRHPLLKAWADAVKERDNYTCQHCGTTESVKMCAHHKKDKYDYPDEMYNIENGITLCIKCHMKLHNTGRHLSKETKRKMSLSSIDKCNKAVVQIDKDTNEIIREYKSVSIAAKENGIFQCNVTACCRGRQKTSGGYKWNYKGNN